MDDAPGIFKKVHPARLNTLILTGELWTYLADLNEQAQEQLEHYHGTDEKAAEGVTEELKHSQMEWAQC